jgi:sensor histidine kinase YesM
LYESSVEKVLLTQEIHFLEEYIALMQTRMGDQIDVDFVTEIDFPAKIAPQLFFPLVENAFKYVSEKEGTIFIFIKSERDKVTCEVKNSFAKNKKNNYGGVGLANLKRRLELLYPQLFELSLDQDDSFYYAKISLRNQ